MPDTSRPHHHGNLRDALIDAGLALLREGGTGALTLRRAASRAGVSHAAPAHHFDGLRGLLTAIATRAFGDFTAAMQAARARAEPTAFGGVLGICTGYMDYAEQNSGLFHLIFVSSEVDRADPALRAAADAAYGTLRAACLPFSADGQPDKMTEAAVWSLVHGFTLLRLNSRETMAGRPDFSLLLQRVLPKNAQPLLPPSESCAISPPRSAGVAQG